MSMKLYVGNLPHQMTEEQLNTLFSEAGYVASAKIINDRQHGCRLFLFDWRDITCAHISAHIMCACTYAMAVNVSSASTAPTATCLANSSVLQTKCRKLVKLIR